MDEARAMEILGDLVQPGNGLFRGNNNLNYIDWPVDFDIVYLDGGYSAETLEAIAWWMRNKGH